MRAKSIKLRKKIPIYSTSSHSVRTNVLSFLLLKTASRAMGAVIVRQYDV